MDSPSLFPAIPVLAQWAMVTEMGDIHGLDNIDCHLATVGECQLQRPTLSPIYGIIPGGDLLAGLDLTRVDSYSGCGFAFSEHVSAWPWKMLCPL